MSSQTLGGMSHPHRLFVAFVAVASASTGAAKIPSACILTTTA